MIRKFLRGERSPVWYDLTAILISVLLCIGLGLFNIWYTQTEAHHTEQKFCRVIGVQVNAYDETPPKTPTGIKVAAAMKQLAHDLNCEGTRLK